MCEAQEGQTSSHQRGRDFPCVRVLASKRLSHTGSTGEEPACQIRSSVQSRHDLFLRAWGRVQRSWCQDILLRPLTILWVAQNVGGHQGQCVGSPSGLYIPERDSADALLESKGLFRAGFMELRELQASLCSNVLGHGQAPEAESDSFWRVLALIHLALP